MSRRVSGRPGLAAVPLIAVVYTRVSKDKSKRRKSVTEQLSEAQETAHRESWVIPDDAVFTDNHRSASRFATKPRVGWGQVIAYLESTPIHVLILWEVSRGDRRLGPWIGLLDLCRERNILIHIVKDEETYDPSDPRDRKYLAQEGIEAESESERISKRILRDKRAAALAGRPAGKLNYGYRRIYNERGRYVATVVDEHQKMVKQDYIDEGIASGRPKYAIAADLNRERATTRAEAWRQAREVAAGPGDWPTRRAAVRAAVQHGQRWDSPGGGIWHPTTIVRLAASPTYLGKRIHQGEVVGDTDWPQITDERTFRRIQQRLGGKDQRRQLDTRLRNQLSGAAMCGRDGCGGRFMIGPKGLYYRCARCVRCSINKATADRLVDKMIKARLLAVDAAVLFVDPEDDGALEIAESEVRTLQERLDDHYAEAAAGRLSARGLGLVEADLMPRIETARARANELGRPSELRGIDPVELAENWEDQPVDLRRRVILGLADIRVSAIGRGKRPTASRLAQSRWRGDSLTWGDHWQSAGIMPT
jgi:site-specific DNA recombinase